MTSEGPKVNIVNRWSPNVGFAHNDNIFINQMTNFYGAKMVVSTLRFRPFIEYTRISEDSLVVEPKDALDMWMLDAMAKKLNFSTEIRESTDGLWGTFVDGHYTGIIGDVEFWRGNMSLAVSITPGRLSHVDYTRAYYIDPLVFVLSKDRPAPKWMKLISPFTMTVWVTMLILIISGALLYYFFYLVQELIDLKSTTVTKSFLEIFGSFIAQGIPSMSWLTASQIFLGFWFLTGLILTTYYKTSLTAALAVPAKSPTIDTLEQLYASDLNYGMASAKGSEYVFFSTTKIPLYANLFKKMTFYDLGESMRLVAEGKYAYIYFKSMIESTVNSDFTNSKGESSLHISPKGFFPSPYGWCFPKGAPYASAIDTTLAQLIEAGLVDKWLKDVAVIYNKEARDMREAERQAKGNHAKAEKRDDGLVVLNLDILQGPFLILIFGNVFGSVVFGAEIFISSFAK